METISKSEQKNSLERLQNLLNEGDTIYCILRHISRSGMSRLISFSCIKEEKHINLDYDISKILNYRRGKYEGLKVSGCGMDMGFSVVYEIGRKIFPNGGSLEHSPRKYQEERAGNQTEIDGGYLLKHQWI
ncbi:MAG: hypothetical protein KJ879_03665 [Nanoarchaeota archaeon]|nr:hypothetical protein [Nanoarchaeota archaeon]